MNRGDLLLLGFVGPRLEPNPQVSVSAFRRSPERPSPSGQCAALSDNATIHDKWSVGVVCRLPAG